MLVRNSQCWLLTLNLAWAETVFSFWRYIHNSKHCLTNSCTATNPSSISIFLHIFLHKLPLEMTCRMSKDQEKWIFQFMTPLMLSSWFYVLCMLPRNKLTGSQYVSGAAEISSSCSKLSVISLLHSTFSIFRSALALQTLVRETRCIRLFSAASTPYTSELFYFLFSLWDLHVLLHCYQNIHV